VNGGFVSNSDSWPKKTNGCKCQKRSFMHPTANGCLEPEADMVPHQCSQMHQCNLPNPSSTAQREKQTLIATAANFRGSMTELRTFQTSPSWRQLAHSVDSSHMLVVLRMAAVGKREFQSEALRLVARTHRAICSESGLINRNAHEK